MARYNEMGLKWCCGYGPAGIKGHWEFPDMFPKKKSTEDGLHNYCKVCARAYNTGPMKKHHNSKRCGENADPNAKATRMAWDAYKRALKMERTPKWLDKEEKKLIRDLYKERDRLNREEGYIKYHVDHIFPLAGKTVSGLHVLNNLEIITAEENLRKTNKYEASI